MLGPVTRTESHALELPARTRVTPQRRAVLDAIEALDGAFTPIELFDRARLTDPHLGLATVYRTVELLRQTGSVRLLVHEGRPTYVRCHAGHHHHLVCTSCGSVEETELCAAPSPAQLRKRHGFRAQDHQVDIYGICERCA
jgi:Fur family transcriptional regulator, ferric uptake regulator